MKCNRSRIAESNSLSILAVFARTDRYRIKYNRLFTHVLISNTHIIRNLTIMRNRVFGGLVDYRTDNKWRVESERSYTDNDDVLGRSDRLGCHVTTVTDRFTSRALPMRAHNNYDYAYCAVDYSDGWDDDRKHEIHQVDRRQILFIREAIDARHGIPCYVHVEDRRREHATDYPLQNDDHVARSASKKKLVSQWLQYNDCLRDGQPT